MNRSRRDPTPLVPAIAASALLAVFAGLVATPAEGQEPPAVDTTGLGTGPYARMSTLLEKTIFKVDVLTLDVRLGERETAALDRLLSGIGPGAVEEPALSDSIASVALGARDAWARIEFLRGVSLGRFLDGIRDNLREAEEAGIISSDRYEGIASDLPRWYGFLEKRGIRDGDRMFYRIRGDTLHTVYSSESGERLLDQVDVGPDRRLAVLGGYFAPGSDFRGGLVESVLRERRRSGS